MNSWDPLGVRGHAQLSEVYDPYISQVARLILSGADVADLAEALRWIEAERMGLKSFSSNIHAAAQQLIEAFAGHPQRPAVD